MGGLLCRLVLSFVTSLILFVVGLVADLGVVYVVGWVVVVFRCVTWV